MSSRESRIWSAEAAARNHTRWNARKDDLYQDAGFPNFHYVRFELGEGSAQGDDVSAWPTLMPRS